MPQLAAVIALCNFKGCSNPASHHYRWEWGEEGNCCATCVQLMQQTAGNLSRTIQFRTLDASAEPPLQRSERTQLIAAKLSAEQELEEVKSRGHKLYQQNVSLAQEVQQHLNRSRTLSDTVASQTGQIEELAAQLSTKETELATQSTELQRLRLLVPFVGDPSERGLDGEEQSRVDGR
jgi:seryl-tRNA synthetase